MGFGLAIGSWIVEGQSMQGTGKHRVAGGFGLRYGALYLGPLIHSYYLTYRQLPSFRA